MAQFAVHQLEGVNYVDIILKDETVRAEAGALAYFKGDITVYSPLLPSIGGAFKSILANEAIYRPTYSGNGVLTLQSSLAGFHIMELVEGDSWVLERGIYWASELGIDVSFHRVDFWTSLWAGEPPIYLQTRVSGRGKLAVRTRGPIEQITLGEDERIAVDGKSVIGWSSDVRFRIRRPTKNFFGKLTAGQGFLRVYVGPGRVLLNPAPNWRYYLASQKDGSDGLAFLTA